MLTTNKNLSQSKTKIVKIKVKRILLKIKQLIFFVETDEDGSWVLKWQTTYKFNEI